MIISFRCKKVTTKARQLNQLSETEQKAQTPGGHEATCSGPHKTRWKLHACVECELPTHSTTYAFKQNVSRQNQSVDLPDSRCAPLWTWRTGDSGQGAALARTWVLSAALGLVSLTAFVHLISLGSAAEPMPIQLRNCHTQTHKQISGHILSCSAQSEACPSGTAGVNLPGKMAGRWRGWLCTTLCTESVQQDPHSRNNTRNSGLPTIHTRLISRTVLFVRGALTARGARVAP